ncbi:MAG: fibronectin type III domain-containing protein, partial [Lachnospiraceae bacterium]
TIASIEEKIPAGAISVNTQDNVQVEGDLESLLKGDSSVTLTSDDTISQTNPITLDFEIAQQAGSIDGLVIGTDKENPITSGEITLEYVNENGETVTETFPVQSEVNFLLRNSGVTVEVKEDGSIELNLGKQIAVKKVSIKITGVKNNNNLAEISKVEFVNGMENRIPAPVMDIPENVAIVAGDKTFTVRWTPSVNVTGYEVSIEHNGTEEVHRVTGNELVVTKFGEEKLVNKEVYKVKVQSINGTWRSGYSPAVDAIPVTNEKPPKPDGLTIIGKYMSIQASWKAMEDTDSYNLYYREKGSVEYTKIEGILTNNYTITGLKDKTSYQVYITGVNDLGESEPSITSVAETTSIDPAVMPKYKVINRPVEGQVSEHIISAVVKNGQMIDSPLDANSSSAWGIVDSNPTSYFNLASWDSGGYNYLGNNGVVVEFDQTYTIDTMAIQEITPQSPNYGYAQIRYWNEQGEETYLDKDHISVQRKQDLNGKVYYMLKLSAPIQAKKIQLGLARAVASGTITISEIYFYEYDTIKEEIMELYSDDLHTVLRKDVNQDTIDGLRTRLNTPDEYSGEYHFEKEALEKELQTAEYILNEQNLSKSLEIHNTITTKDTNRGFSGLNAWQPLGITAAAGEEVVIYVGHNSKKTGDNTNLQLVATQYHAESSAMHKVVATLKVGRNEIIIPQIATVDGELGGALYIQYTGNNINDRYAVRVSGGVQVPTLDLYNVTEEQEKTARAQAYITALDAYVNRIEETHSQQHQSSENVNVQYEYDAKNCILGATDIMLNTMMLSIPAQQVLAGVGNGDVATRAEKLLESMQAMEDMMHLFYQHKGLNNSAADDINRLPKGHLNIRYQRMFAGAFMYAAGNHIGIEWNESKGMMGGVPVVSDEKGKYISGQYFGWGIAHEIGHNINQGAYAIAEITNNYFAQLAQAKDDNSSVRFVYDDIYAKVTSGTKGYSSNVFVQLGMYWQLHLAYDTGYNYKTYDTYEEQLNNLFFARVDTYARNVKKAPMPGNVALVLSGNRDQDLMRLAIAAAEKNILDFFERWGFTPDETTKAYAEQFEKETRAIYYVNDDSRVYRLENSGSNLDETVQAVGDSTSAKVNPNVPNQVDFTLSSKIIPSDDVLGYEITRSTISGGVVEKQVVGFTTSNTFSDHVTTMNNRVVTYEVTVIDKYLNRSAVKTLEPIKIEHDGSLAKTFWTVTTNLKDVDEVESGNGTEQTPCGPEVEASINRVIDNKIETTYTGVASQNSEIVVEFNQELVITGLKYTANAGNLINDYEIYVRGENNDWVSVKAGTFTDDAIQTVYFENSDNKYVSTYATTAVKLVIKDQSGYEVSISELDILGITGDNVDFRDANDGTVAIGKLTNDYKYGQNETDVIPAGSVIFTGSYKGNPVYNVVLLYDQDGNIVGGTDEEGALVAQQIILADLPAEGEIQDVADGTWIYWIEPTNGEIELSSVKNVRAELYRVNNAQTNEGQRLVSDSLFKVMPESLPEIELTSNK